MFVITNIEPFETEQDALAAAKGLGADYGIYEVDVDNDEDYDDDDLDEDEEEDID